MSIQKFRLLRSYWCGAKPHNDTEENRLIKNEYSTDFFEEEPNNIPKGVIIENLSKEFRSGFTTKMAVNDVSLNIYEGQITALLGHNGAGKTTTINILTGLYTPTNGTASIYGLDILAETTRARRGLGVCPQHNVLYDTLTVEEHLRIYAAMKGVPWKELNFEVTQILDIMKLADKKSELTKNLSGGMKRKLSLGIALIGGSKVLFLDEPTSGMDVEARRSVWDALLEIRHNRTIILTTHYMEEADILGDRIAIMAEGEVQCCGSPMFLKQKFAAEKEAERLAVAAEKEAERQFELEKSRIEAGVSRNMTHANSSQEVTDQAKFDLSRILPKFNPKEDEIGLYLTMFERQLKFVNIPETNWIPYLIGSLPSEINQMIVKENEEDSKDYAKVKEMLLKRYRLTADRFRQLFVQHQKSAEITWKDYTFELKSYFEGWTTELNIS
ncbi:ATP-binding cassette sub-family A member 3, partial [Araneus ventricosus]